MSFNGRKVGFDPTNAGSNPAAATNLGSSVWYFEEAARCDLGGKGPLRLSRDDFYFCWDVFQW